MVRAAEPPDIDGVVNFCMGQAAVWKAQRAASVSDREAIEREVVRLEGIVSKLTDAIEAGQPVRGYLRRFNQS